MNKDEDPTIKIITIGNAGVGKTSIIKRFVSNEFEENTASTLGLEFTYKKINLNNNRTINIKLIDTGGQEKYRALSKTYFKNTDGVLFVFALNNEMSFTDLTEWIVLFNENHNGKDNIPKYLVGNKSDLKKEVDNNNINKFCVQNNLKYFETSAKDNKYINDLFEDIAKFFYETYEKTNLNNTQKAIKIQSQSQNKQKRCILFTKDVY